MTIETANRIESLITSEQYAEAVRLLSEWIELTPDDDALFFKRGLIFWRLGQRGAATSDYTKAVLINPDSPAARALEMAHDVADFFNPDLYNP